MTVEVPQRPAAPVVAVIERRRPTEQEVREIADRMEKSGLKPSPRKIAAKIKQMPQYLPVGDVTIWRWLNGTQKAKPQEPTGETVAAAVAAAANADIPVDADVPVFEGEAANLLAELMIEPGATEALDGLQDETDGTLCRKAAREALMRSIIISRKISLRHDTLLRDDPKGLAALIKAVDGTLVAATTAFERALDIADRAMKLVPKQIEQGPQGPKTDPAVASLIDFEREISARKAAR